MRERDHTLILDGPKAFSHWNVQDDWATFRLPGHPGKYRKVEVALWPEFDRLSFNVGTLARSNDRVAAQLLFLCGAAFLQQFPTEPC